MAERQSPQIRRRRLGLELRRLRESAGLTGDEVAERLRWSPSKVSRIETGRTSVTWGDVSDLLDLYELEDDDIRQALIALARDSRERGWWQSFGDVMSKGYATLVGFETAAQELWLFEPLTVPGLLQTPDYARAVMLGNPHQMSTEEIDRRVEVRMNRQMVLNSEDPLRLWVILDEAVLHRQTGGPEIMAAQLHHLADAARQPGINVQVIPFTGGAHAAMTGAFGIFEFTEASDRDIAYIDSLTGELYLERDSDIRATRDAFGYLRAIALPLDRSLSLITETANAYRK